MGETQEENGRTGEAGSGADIGRGPRGTLWYGGVVHGTARPLYDVTIVLTSAAAGLARVETCPEGAHRIVVRIPREEAVSRRLRDRERERVLDALADTLIYLTARGDHLASLRAASPRRWVTCVTVALACDASAHGGVDFERSAATLGVTPATLREWVEADAALREAVAEPKLLGARQRQSRAASTPRSASHAADLSMTSR